MDLSSRSVKAAQRYLLEASLLWSQAAGAVTGLIVARVAGADTRGVVAALTTWGQLLGWVVSVSLDKALVVETQESKAVPRIALATSRVISLMTWVPMAAVASLLGTLIFDDGRLILVFVALIGVAANLELVGGWLLSTASMQRYAIFRGTQPTVYLFLCLLAALSPIESESGLALIFAGAVLVSTVSPYVFGPWDRGIAKDFSLGRRMLRIGVKAQGAMVFQFLNSRLDLLVLSLVATSAEVGEYAVGLSVGQAAVFLGSAAAIRKFVGADHANETKAIAAVAILGAVLAVAAPVIIPALYGEDFPRSIGVAQIFALGGVMNYLQQGYSGRLFRLNRPGQLVMGQALGAVAFGIGVSISRDLRIVAISSVASYAVCAGILVGCVRRAESSQASREIVDEGDQQ